MLSDGVLSALANRKDLLQKFPFFRWTTRAPITRGCRCGASAQARVAVSKEAERIKNAIMSLPEDRLRELKAMLAVDSISFFLAADKGIVRHSK